MAERCRLVVAWTLHLALLVLMTLQEGRLVQTHGVLSSIPKGHERLMFDTRDNGQLQESLGRSQND